MVLERLRMGAWEVSWEAFGDLFEPWQGSLRALGGSWEALGSLLGRLGRLLGAIWTVLGHSWEHLGVM